MNRVGTACAFVGGSRQGIREMVVPTSAKYLHTAATTFDSQLLTTGHDVDNAVCDKGGVGPSFADDTERTGASIPCPGMSDAAHVVVVDVPLTWLMPLGDDGLGVLEY